MRTQKQVHADGETWRMAVLTLQTVGEGMEYSIHSNVMINYMQKINLGPSSTIYVIINSRLN